MFDPVTSALIAASPPLNGLDLGALPKKLTEAFAEIVLARIRLRGERGQGASAELSNTLSEMRRLAAAHEAFVALLPDRTNRSAAAFVAASAHMACLLGQSSPETARNPSYVDGATVSPEVCAALLFLVAESHADAAECAKRINASGENASGAEKVLLSGVKLLASGRLAELAQLPLPELLETGDSADFAVDALRLELFKGIKNLAARLMIRVDIDPVLGGVAPASDFFERVKKLCVGQVENVFSTEDHIFSVFPGPLHVANLLLAIDKDLISSALTRIPTPSGASDDGWWQIIRRMATRRPFLWRNHREAIERGYLERGISSAISFPTGGGKSTLAQLKIGTALLRGEKVVFLAPTHALVDQTTKDLQTAFDNFDVVGDLDDDVTFDSVVILPEVIVTTPERCLILMSAQPDAFSDLGLIVFDGCHLLHPRDVERSRRSVDAMLAILNLTSLAPNADLLMLSAMMKNSAEIAAWIKELAERECLSLNLAWKPTRQVRGSVVYPANRIKELGENLRKARVANPKHVNAPAKVVRDMKAQPFGFFSLLQTWSTQDSSDYTLLPLLAGEHSLSTGRSKRGNWYLTPNGNQTAASIAAAAASSGLKTLVFVQSTVLAEASATQFRNLIADQAVELSDEENALYQLAAEEMGNQEHCYLDLEENGTFAGGAASHHALLLREERHLHESLFKRKVGINVLFATSTLAQGMNLPSEIVIIAGDSRFDQNEDKMAQLEAHELLNAAGRAGRAGEQSQGFVLVVPSRLVEYDDETKLINEHWMTLKTIFSQSDQCLDIDDPTTILFDHIHAGTILQGMPAYLISRLPPAGEDGTDTSIRNLIGRSLGAFRARQRGDENWVQSRIASAFAARKASELEMAEQWLGKVSGLTGVSLKVLSEIAELSNNLSPTSSSIEVVNAIFAWLQKKPEYFLELVRLENIETLFGGEYATFNTDRERGEFVLPLIQSWLLLWMGGAPLNVMEKTYPNGGDSKRCKHSRHFVLKLVPDLAFIAGLPALILTAQRNNDGNGDPLPIVLATLGASVREGCDSPESLAARINLGKGISRVAAHHGFEQWRRHLEPGDPNETFEITRNRVRVAADFTQILDS